MILEQAKELNYAERMYREYGTDYWYHRYEAAKAHVGELIRLTKNEPGQRTKQTKFIHLRGMLKKSTSFLRLLYHKK